MRVAGAGSGVALAVGTAGDERLAGQEDALLGAEADLETDVVLDQGAFVVDPDR